MYLDAAHQMRVRVSSRPTMATFQPSAASASAAAKPMPLVPPVMRICLGMLWAGLYMTSLSPGYGAGADCEAPMIYLNHTIVPARDKERPRACSRTFSVSPTTALAGISRRSRSTTR